MPGSYMNSKKRVLFICAHNSARSPMAEALLRYIAPEQFETFSAGIQPTQVDSRVPAVLSQMDIPSEGLHSKPLEAFDGQQFDYVITLCDKSAQEYQMMPRGEEVIAWNVEDPQASSKPDAFRHALSEMNERLKIFVLLKTKPDRQEAHHLPPV